MGCDIHMYSEELTEDGWKALDPWKTYKNDDGSPYLSVDYNKMVYSSRNYSLFCMLAEVRGSEHALFDIKGFPNDTCDEIAKCFEEWGEDAHTPSYITAEEITKFLEGEPLWPYCGFLKKKDIAELMYGIENNDPDWDVIERYEPHKYRNPQGTEDDFIEYTVDAPIKYSVGNVFEEILGKIPETGRVVFWFDN